MNNDKTFTTINNKENKNIKNIFIKPNKIFYDIYNDYIKKPNNNESNSYILNLISIKSKLIIPEIITKKKYLEKIDKNKLSNNYLKNFYNDLNSIKQTCNICLDSFNDNYVITSCYHVFCLICYNKLCKYKQNNIVDNLFENTLEYKKLNHNTSNNKIKCPKCMNVFNKTNAYLISNSTYLKTKQKCINNENKTNLLLYLYKKNKTIQKYLLHHIGYKTIYFIDKIEQFYNISINNINNIFIYILIINPYWENLIKELIPINKLNNIKFIKISDLEIKKFINKQFYIYIFEPLRLKYKQKLYNFIDNIDKTLIATKSNTKNKFSYKIINLVIKNTIDEKIANNEVILN